MALSNLAGWNEKFAACSSACGAGDKLEEINTPAGLIESLGKYTVDLETSEGAKSHYFHSRPEAISFLSSLDGQCTLRETTLEDVFVERAGRHLMQK